MEMFNFIGATFTSIAYIISICLLTKKMSEQKEDNGWKINNGDQRAFVY